MHAYIFGGPWPQDTLGHPFAGAARVVMPGIWPGVGLQLRL